MTSSEKKRKMDENPPPSDNPVTMDEYTDAVSFSASAHQQMLEMSKSKTPVTLPNVQMSPSLKSSGKFDVKYNHRSNMTPARNLDFEFQLPEHSKYRTIKEVEENLNAFQKDGCCQLVIVDEWVAGTAYWLCGWIQICIDLANRRSLTSVTLSMYPGGFAEGSLRRS
uniref:Uncharacterized protein n=1 Tax=Magallana gigas TaxID=29159 RepID=K1PDH8_MAGGI